MNKMGYDFHCWPHKVEIQPILHVDIDIQRRYEPATLLVAEQGFGGEGLRSGSEKNSSLTC